MVTGSARGIGAAVARGFEAAGDTVLGCDLREGPGVSVLDVRDAEAVSAWAESARAAHGRVDVLVNNAGGTFHAPFLEVSAKGEETLIAENFTQVTRLIRLVVPLMGPGSSIVNVTSSEAHQAAPGFAVYAAMKAALASLTRSLALELAPLGIRVNAVAPDAIATEGEEGARAGMLAAAPLYDPVRTPPLGHLGTPDDAAAVVAFLASPAARFVTGTTLHVDGGIWAAGGWRRT
ncbi:SDR family oxidoreductase [Actinocorallia longicatena]|uniref:SDR family oxidoreductase n=2 Tax=Actinocorallia longicatena TaxID=111803 RepID=A0ABP6Q8Z3_9ACTN